MEPSGRGRQGWLCSRGEGSGRNEQVAWDGRGRARSAAARGGRGTCVVGTSGLPGHQQPMVDGETGTQSGRKWGVKPQGLDQGDSDTPL